MNSSSITTHGDNKKTETAVKGEIPFTASFLDFAVECTFELAVKGRGHYLNLEPPLTSLLRSANAFFLERRSPPIADARSLRVTTHLFP